MVDLVCVSEELADAGINHGLPIDVVSVHGHGVQRRECVCHGLEGEVHHHEGVDGLPVLAVVELSLKLLLERCTCVCHVSVYLSAGWNRTTPSTMCACLCVRGNRPRTPRQRLGRSRPAERPTEQHLPAPTLQELRRSRTRFCG